MNNAIVTIRKEIQCEFCGEYEYIDCYARADSDDPDSLFSPITCPNCDEGFMAMGFTPRIHIKS